MQKIKISVKTAAEIGALLALLLFAAVGAVSQWYNLGGSFLRIYFNGEELCCVKESVDVRRLLQQERRALALADDKPLYMEYDVSFEASDEWFVPLTAEEDAAAQLSEKLKESVIPKDAKGCSVAIEGFHANFTDLNEAIGFFEAVKAEADPDHQFIPEISKEKGHITGILTAYLAETKSREKTEAIPEESAADHIVSGACRALMQSMEYAQANPDTGDSGNEYQMGLLSMEFMEKIEVYERALAPEELADVKDAVAEVTKEKETNKIYVVESGDCLSVIALDHETTVASIVKLNGLENADVTIWPGDELIIAVPEPDLRMRIQTGVVYDEDYNADPVIIENDTWYTTKEVVHDEGTTGYRERNDIVTFENGYEVGREMIHERIIVESKPAVIERGTITPPTYIRPLIGGYKSSNFGYRWGRLHKGVDIACPVGTIVFASSAGTVLSANYNGGYGYNVVISHPDGKMTRYAHCSKLLVSAGQSVEQGETIALSGNTGRSTGPHVHFEIYVDGVAVDPLNYIGY